MIKAIWIACLLIFTCFFATTAQSAIVFDYLTTCDNCQNPAEIAKSTIPSYEGQWHEESGETAEYRVLVLDPVSNIYYYYEVWVKENGKYSRKSTPTGYAKDVAQQALSYYHTKGKIIDALNRGPLSAQLSSSQSPDCSNPGLVYNNETCREMFYADISQNVLTDKVDAWLVLMNNTSLSFDSSVGGFKLTAKYDQSANKVHYNMANGVIITFNLNPLGTSILGVDVIDSRFSNGASLQSYLSRNSLSEASGYSTQNFMDSHRCRVKSGGRIYATYTYTIVKAADGSVLIKVHTSVSETEDGPDIGCGFSY